MLTLYAVKKELLHLYVFAVCFRRSLGRNCMLYSNLTKVSYCILIGVLHIVCQVKFYP
ncbi:hypothetical protein BD408DRAFT_424304 [Parasitella parasitica]|nr:hypothetical protein BD408DRAFT_424304 [Parasitella parasitica]